MRAAGTWMAKNNNKIKGVALAASESDQLAR